MQDTAKLRNGRKILFLVTEDWYFISHRLDLARALRDLGWQVVVATRVQAHGAEIEREGFQLCPLRMRRRDRAPWKEIPSILELIRIVKRERPDVMFCVSLKPVIYGGLVAVLLRQPAVVHMLAGMGYIFTAGSLRVRVSRRMIVSALRGVLRHPRNHLIVQNQHDAESLTAAGIISPGAVTTIKGAGVDLKQFRPTPEPPEPVTVAVVSRMLKDKGIHETVEAARELKKRGVAIRIWLVGEPDPDNPTSLPEETLRNWHREGCIEWLGYRDDIAGVWAQAHIALLASYREGMPKSLIEAAACGRPLVTTDVPGCNELVTDGVDGFLVPRRESAGIVDALQRLAASPDLRSRMGLAARATVEAGYGRESVVQLTIKVCEDALAEPPSGSAGTVGAATP